MLRSPQTRALFERSTSLTGALLCCICIGMGCATTFSPTPRDFSYFDNPDAGDAWTPKIEGWQHRELNDDGRSRPDVAAEGDDEAAIKAPGIDPEAEQSDTLRAKYFDFRAERKREVARSFAAWIQGQAREHYVEDGGTDHWATLEETLRSDGDDCDGLELLTFHGLRDLGFADTEVYRAIVYRESDNQHHMVTLWFEDPSDPWVIDPTGAMTKGMPRMSEMPGWIPLKVFSDTAEYTVRVQRRVELPSHLAQHP